MRIVAFFSRWVVFSLITAVGFMVIPTEDLVVDRNLRLSISALQVLVLACIYILYTVVDSILHIIRHTSPPRFARLEEGAGRAQAKVGDEERSTSSRARSTPSQACEKEPEEEKEASEAGGCPEMDIDSISCVLTAKEGVHFDSQERLDVYILRVHAVGLALWQTFLSFDCTSRDIDICFITGLVMGWFFVNVRRRQHGCLQLFCAVYYATLMCALILSEEHVFTTAMPAHEYLTLAGRVQFYFNICVLPFLTGAFWVVMASSVECDVVLDARRSIVTFLLISLTFPLYWTRIDLTMVQAFMANLPHMSILTLLLLSPVFKFISIYITLLSIQKRHTLDLVVALAMVLFCSSVVLYDFDAVLCVRLVLAGVLLLGQVMLIQCNKCQTIALN